MYQGKQSATKASASLTPQVARADKANAEIVRKGITLQQIHGTEYAAQFLRENHVDIEVIMRVLMNLSESRRHDDLMDAPVPVYLSRRNRGNN